MNLSMSAHFKRMIVMSLQCEGSIEMNKNALMYHLIDETNVSDFKNEAVTPTSMMKHGKYIGAYLDNKPVAFASVVYKGDKGDYFNVKECDLYLQKLYTFKKYRGRGIMKDVISHCIHIPEAGRKPPQTVILCVRPDNQAAIKCYEKFGFQKIRDVFFIRFFKDYIVPRHNI